MAIGRKLTCHYHAPHLVLIAGLSNAGKSSFANLLEERRSITHVPLDKYFLPVPTGELFLHWVQKPESIDWELLDRHLRVLRSGRDCYSPAYDPWGTGQRLSAGENDPHPRSRPMRTSPIGYAVPGCLAFEYANEAFTTIRIFLDVPLQTIASRHAGRAVASAEIDQFLISNLTPSYKAILNYKECADSVLRGDASEEEQLRCWEAVAGS